MSDVLKPDICVIGAGSGGLSVAAGAAAFGVPVVLIERGRMGGDCLNTGCVPSKALIAAGNRALAMRGAAPFGIAAVDPQVNFRKVHDHVHTVIDSIAPVDSAARYRAMGVTVIEAEARFEGPGTVVAGDWRIEARRFVVATGSRPAVPPVEGLAEIGYHTSETVFGITRKPAHLIVIGGGPAGLELAQAFRRLGSEVTVLEAATPLAAGRVATTEGLCLDKAHIVVDEEGIRVDRRMRSSNRRIYAVGDVARGPEYTHVADYQAGIALRNILFRRGARASYDHIPRVTFTDPELAQVGMTEAEAAGRYGRVRVLRWPYAENDRARMERVTDGFIKVVTSSRGRILGAGIAGACAGEIVQMWGLAIHRRLDIKAMTGFVSPYPTLAEIGRRAAIEFYRPGLTGQRVRRIISLLRRFG